MNELANRAFAAKAALHQEINDLIHDERGNMRKYDGTTHDVYWPFTSDKGAAESECERLPLGGWVQKNGVRRGSRTDYPDYICAFVWRLHPKHYNAGGVPMSFSGDEHSEEMYAGSDTEKLMAEDGNIQIYWTWKSWVSGGPTYWGHRMGDPVMEVRENGVAIFATCPTKDVHAEFQLSEFLDAHMSAQKYVPYELKIRTDEELSLWSDLGRIKQ